MDLLPKVGSVDPYAGDQRPGGGSPRRRGKDGRERQDGGSADDQAQAQIEAPIDPLLAELDRLRAIDPALTESGAHRALMALRAYHHGPIDIPADIPPPPPPPIDGADAASTVDTRSFVRRPPVTGSALESP